MPPNTRRYFEESGNLLEGRSPDQSREFEALLRSKVGDQFKGLVTPENVGLMALIGNPRSKYSLRGVNYYPGFSSTTDKQEELIREELSNVLEEGNQELPKGKKIFGLGAAADPRLYAHELRHESTKHEGSNRLFDLMYSSTSIPAYKDNIEKAYDHLIYTTENRKLPFKERLRLANAPINEKEEFVLNALKSKSNNWILRDAAREEGISFISSFKAADIEKFIDRNLELNRSGAVGGFQGSKKLPSSLIEYRSKFPFLNFIGRIDEPAPKKKATGGNVEKVYIDRKMI